MSRQLPAHALMVTFLSDALSRRRITIEHLADLLAPIPERTIKSWLSGWKLPSLNDLVPLATALHVHPVEMIAGWMIEQSPDLESAIRARLLDPLRSTFPRTIDLDLRAPRPRMDMNVGDPHDERAPLRSPALAVGRKIRKRASGAE